MSNRCEGCEGKGYVGPTSPMAKPCQVCNGTGRGHVHAWALLGSPLAEGDIKRKCKGCSEIQSTPSENLVEIPTAVHVFYGMPHTFRGPPEFKFPKDYLAIADVPWASCAKAEGP